MLRPEIIEKIRKEKEERDRPAAQIPLYVPEIRNPNDYIEEQEEKTERVIVIDLSSLRKQGSPIKPLGDDKFHKSWQLI